MNNRIWGDSNSTMGELVIDLSKAPGWLTPFVVIAIIIFILKMRSSDEVEFLGFKLRYNKDLRELLRQSQVELRKLQALPPIVGLYGAELSEVLVIATTDPRSVSQRISKLYDMILTAIPQLISSDGFHRAAILYPLLGSPDQLHVAKSIFSVQALKGTWYLAQDQFRIACTCLEGNTTAEILGPYRSTAQCRSPDIRGLLPQ
jgi:hypothetical protein